MSRSEALADKASMVYAATEYTLWSRPGAADEAMPASVRWSYEAFERIIRNPASFFAPGAPTLRGLALSPETAAGIRAYLASSDPSALWTDYEHGVTHPLYMPTVSTHARRAVARASALCWAFLVAEFGCYGDEPERQAQQRTLLDLAVTTAVMDDMRLTLYLRHRLATGEYRWPIPAMSAEMKAVA